MSHICFVQSYANVTLYFIGLLFENLVLLIIRKPQNLRITFRVYTRGNDSHVRLLLVLLSFLYLLIVASARVVAQSHAELHV